MAHDPETRRFLLAGVPISVTSMTGLVGTIHRRLVARTAETGGAFVVFRDAHGLVRAHSDPLLRSAHDDALLVCSDGWPIAAAGRWLGHRGVSQVPGIEAMEAVCRAGVLAGWRHYFLGGTPDVVAELVETMARRVPGLVVAGSESPPFRTSTADETEAMRARVRRSGADIVWIGLGTPKQELWMHAQAPHLPGTIAMGVGAAFDVNAGRLARAPSWVRAAGLEWFYRVLQEPRRLFWRYAVTVPRFILLMLREVIAR